MTDHAFSTIVRTILERRWGHGATDIGVVRLRAGLESVRVVRVGATVRTRGCRAERISFVVKQLPKGRVREAVIYRALARSRLRLAPRCLGVERGRDGARLLLLEAARQRVTWPWRNTNAIIAVLERLAELHGERELTRAFADSWDYERELLAAARRSVETLARHSCASGGTWQRALPSMRRLVDGLMAFRRELVACRRFGRAAVHGDVHTGNVLLVAHLPRPVVLLLDWSRARTGSRLEDVSSWTESLGLWEPEAHRRHDSLIRAYLAASGCPGALDAELRAHYWLAAASNVLAGSLEHHVGTLDTSAPGSRRFAQSRHATLAAVRVLARAAAYWC